MANSTRSSAREAQRLERGKELLREHLAGVAQSSDNPQEARARAREAIAALQEKKAAELAQAAKRFSVLQKVEFVIGALALIQIAIFVLKGEPRILALIYSTAATLLIYLVVAILDSRAKSHRQDLQAELQATRKVKLKTAADGKLSVEFD